jgi:hypothetical protein
LRPGITLFFVSAYRRQPDGHGQTNARQEVHLSNSLSQVITWFWLSSK